MKLSPLQLAFYKGMKGSHGALQFNPQMPHYYCPDRECKQKKIYDQALPPYCAECKKPVLDSKGEVIRGGIDRKMKSREGAIFVDICSTKGNNQYDWDNKITMALSTGDLAKLLMFLEGGQAGETLSLLHDPGAQTNRAGDIRKTIKFYSPKGLKEGCFVSVLMSMKNRDNVEHKVPLSGSEVKELAVSIRGFIPVARAWA